MRPVVTNARNAPSSWHGRLARVQHRTGEAPVPRCQETPLLPDPALFNNFPLAQHRPAELLRLIELAARGFAGDDEAGFLALAAGCFPAELYDEVFDLLT